MKKRYLALIVAIAAAGLVAALYWTQQEDPAGHIVAPESLRVAVLLPLTGPGATGAKYSQEGFQLALSEIEQDGGKVVLEFEDTQTNPKTAVSIYQAMQTKAAPPKVIVPQLSSVMKALRPMLATDNLTVCTGVSSPNVADPSANIFRVFLSAPGVGRTAAEWAAEIKLKSLCVIYVNDEYGQSVLTATQKQFEQTGGSMASEPFSLLEKDFRTQWQKILQSNPDGVFITGYGPGYIAVLNQLREVGYSGAIITDWSITAPDYLKATQGVRDGTYVVTVQASDDFVRKYEEVYERECSALNAGFSYDTLKVIWQAYKNSDGSVSGMSDAILSLKGYPGVMDAKGFGKDGELAISYSVLTIKDGKLTEVE